MLSCWCSGTAVVRLGSVVAPCTGQLTEVPFDCPKCDVAGTAKVCGDHLRELRHRSTLVKCDACGVNGRGWFNSLRLQLPQIVHAEDCLLLAPSPHPQWGTLLVCTCAAQGEWLEFGASCAPLTSAPTDAPTETRRADDSEPTPGSAAQ